MGIETAQCKCVSGEPGRRAVPFGIILCDVGRTLPLAHTLPAGLGLDVGGGLVFPGNAKMPRSSWRRDRWPSVDGDFATASGACSSRVRMDSMLSVELEARSRARSEFSE